VTEIVHCRGEISESNSAQGPGDGHGCMAVGREVITITIDPEVGLCERAVRCTSVLVYKKVCPFVTPLAWSLDDSWSMSSSCSKADLE